MGQWDQKEPTPMVPQKGWNMEKNYVKEITNISVYNFAKCR